MGLEGFVKQIGVHITENEIRAVCVLFRKNRCQLLKTACLPIESTVVQALKILHQQWGFSRAKVIFTVPYDQVICKTVTLAAKLTAHEMDLYFHSQIPQWLGLSLEEIYFDYHALPANQWQIVAIKKNPLQEKISLAKAVALPLRAVDVDLLAMSRLHTFIHPQADESIGVVIIENHYLQFLIMTPNQLRFQARFALPLMDSPLYLQHLLTILSQQMAQQPDLQIVYFSASPIFLANFMEKIQNSLSVSAQPLRISLFKMDSVLDHRLIISLAAALWGLT